MNLINNLNLKAMVLNLRDVTERIKFEEALNKSKDEIEDLYNHAPCGYYSLSKDFVFIRINYTMLKWLGYTRDEVVGKLTIFDIIIPEHREIINIKSRLFVEQGFINNLEFEIARKDGSRIPVLLNSTIVKNEDGEMLMTRSTIVDNTRRIGKV